MGTRKGPSGGSPADVGQRGRAGPLSLAQAPLAFLALGPFPSHPWGPSNCQCEDGFSVCSTGMISVGK